MYDRFTRVHGLHNLIWVWNSLDPAWYPGDDCVDIVAADLYANAGNYGSCKCDFDYAPRALRGRQDGRPERVRRQPRPGALRAGRARPGCGR